MKIIAKIAEALFVFSRLLKLFVLSLVFSYLVLPSNVKASEPESIELVEVEEDITVQDPYLVRRGESGALFQIEYRRLTPTSYLSTIGNAAYDQQYEGESLTGLGFSLLKKFNLSPLSVAVGPLYSQYSLQSSLAEMSLTQIGLRSLIILDGLSDVPQWNPFLGIDLVNSSISETSSTDSFSGSVDIGYAWSLGINILLDTLDRKTAEMAYLESGVQATYLAFWIGDQGDAINSEDPSFSGQPEFGAALTIEF